MWLKRRIFVFGMVFTWWFCVFSLMWMHSCYSGFFIYFVIWLLTILILCKKNQSVDLAWLNVVIIAVVVVLGSIGCYLALICCAWETATCGWGCTVCFKESCLLDFIFVYELWRLAVSEMMFKGEGRVD